jgi:hypothetical protein
VLGILVGECLRIDLDGWNMIKFWLIEHEFLDVLDILDILDPRDPRDSLDPLGPLNFLDLLDLLDLLATDSDLPFKEMINFMIFDNLTDAEVIKSVFSYRILGL